MSDTSTPPERMEIQYDDERLKPLRLVGPRGNLLYATKSVNILEIVGYASVAAEMFGEWSWRWRSQEDYSGWKKDYEKRVIDQDWLCAKGCGGLWSKELSFLKLDNKLAPTVATLDLAQNTLAQIQAAKQQFDSMPDSVEWIPNSLHHLRSTPDLLEQDESDIIRFLDACEQEMALVKHLQTHLEGQQLPLSEPTKQGLRVVIHPGCNYRTAGINELSVGVINGNVVNGQTHSISVFRLKDSFKCFGSAQLLAEMTGLSGWLWLFDDDYQTWRTAYVSRFMKESWAINSLQVDRFLYRKLCNPSSGELSGPWLDKLETMLAKLQAIAERLNEVIDIEIDLPEEVICRLMGIENTKKPSIDIEPLSQMINALRFKLDVLNTLGARSVGT